MGRYPEQTPKNQRNAFEKYIETHSSILRGVDFSSILLKEEELLLLDRVVDKDVFDISAYQSLWFQREQLSEPIQELATAFYIKLLNIRPNFGQPSYGGKHQANSDLYAEIEVTMYPADDIPSVSQTLDMAVHNQFNLNHFDLFKGTALAKIALFRIIKIEDDQVVLGPVPTEEPPLRD